MHQHSELERAAEYVQGTGLQDFPGDVVEKAKLFLTDSIGCGLGAHRSSVGRAIAAAAAHITGGANTVLGLRHGFSPPVAAYLNAALTNALDFDDAYGSHLGATVVPTCIAAAELVDASGAALLEGIVIGYEMSARLGKSMKRYAERTTVHGHGTWQCVGAAFAAARVLRLDVTQTVNAVAIAATAAPVPSGMKTVYGLGGATDSKNNFGPATNTALMSALLAREGFSGPTDVLSGDTGFWRMIGCDAYDPEVWVTELGTRFEFRRVGMKPFPCCRLTQTSVGLAAELLSASGHGPEEVAGITVSSLPLLARFPFSDPTPATMTAVQYSVPFAIAAAISGVPAGPQWFSEATIRSAELRSLSRLVTMQVDPEAEAKRSDEWDVPSEVSIRLRDGRELVGRTSVAYGDSRRPIPPAEVLAKFDRNIGPANHAAFAWIPPSAARLEELPSASKGFIQALRTAVV